MNVKFFNLFHISKVCQYDLGKSFLVTNDTDLSNQKALREYLKSTQRALREKESNQTSSYSRSLKYFILLLLID